MPGRAGPGAPNRAAPPQGAGHLLRGQARQRALLGEGQAAPALGHRQDGQEGVHGHRAHRHQHARPAGECRRPAGGGREAAGSGRPGLTARLSLSAGSAGRRQGEAGPGLVLQPRAGLADRQDRPQGLHPRYGAGGSCPAAGGRCASWGARRARVTRHLRPQARSSPSSPRSTTGRPARWCPEPPSSRRRPSSPAAPRSRRRWWWPAWRATPWPRARGMCGTGAP